MRKTLIDPARPDADPVAEGDWLDLEPIARVELTSEDPAFPVEAALGPGNPAGWRAAAPGPQTLRLRFDSPQRLSRVLLRFRETESARTQEYVLRWAADAAAEPREILRQQWNFDPAGSTESSEDHRVDLEGVRLLELVITPDIGGGPARASLQALRLA